MAATEATAQDCLSAEEMFDSIGPAYEEAFADLKTQLDSIQWALTQIQHRRPAKVLDLGCGTGRPVCSTFVDAGHEVLGVDVSGVMLRDAEAKIPNAKFLKADVFQITLPPDSFDAITVYFSLAIASSQDVIRLQIRRMYQWLRPGGVLVLATVPNSRDRVADSFMGRRFLTSNLSCEEYLSCIKSVGFDVVYYNVSLFKPEAAAKAGICIVENIKEERHLFIYAKKLKD
jgi:ubiquinone/menaquinone biosynthesis C-methylase UbiE